MNKNTNERPSPSALGARARTTVMGPPSGNRPSPTPARLTPASASGCPRPAVGTRVRQHSGGAACGCVPGPEGAREWPARARARRGTPYVELCRTTSVPRSSGSEVPANRSTLVPWAVARAALAETLISTDELTLCGRFNLQRQRQEYLQCLWARDCRLQTGHQAVAMCTSQS